MNKKQKIIDGLNTCEPGQINLFMRMYSPDNLEARIEDVVSLLPPKRVQRSLEQVTQTLEINKLPKPEPEPEPEPEKPTLEELIKPVALEAADDSFYSVKYESLRKIVGGNDEVSFQFDGKEYHIQWDGFWEKADWYDYHIYGNGVNIRGTRELF